MLQPRCHFISFFLSDSYLVYSAMLLTQREPPNIEWV
jgi:hypothetical protein